jgi:hypothetical protein
LFKIATCCDHNIIASWIITIMHAFKFFLICVDTFTRKGVKVDSFAGIYLPWLNVTSTFHGENL